MPPMTPIIPTGLMAVTDGRAGRAAAVRPQRGHPALHGAARSAPSRRACLAFALAAGALAAGCGKEAPKAPPERPPVDVTVLAVEARDVPIGFEFVGQTQSSREIEIRARVDGFLEKRLYDEGTLVRSGQPLFQIDTKPFDATVQTARGELSQQQAALDAAVATLARVRPLAEQNAVSKKDLDDAIANEQRSRAAVIAAQGKVQSAELNQGYTTIASPLTGLSSCAKLPEGSYLSPQANLLTTVAQIDPIWVNFSISENEALRYRDEAQRGRLRFPRDNQFDVEVVLADGSVFPQRGRISFADPSFSKDTGTFLVRSVLANPKSQLRPGQFVRVVVHGAVRPGAILVPQRAVQQGAKSHFVWVAGKDGKAEQRPVEVGQWLGDDWFVDSGLAAGERVVVDGAIRVSAGASLKAAPYAPKSAAAPVAGTTGAVPDAPAAAKREAVPPAGAAAAGAVAAAPSSAAPAGARARILFERDSDLLPAEAAAALAPIARTLAAAPSSRVEITGYADRTGPAERNVQLARDRAKAVRAALIGAGAHPDQTLMKPPAEVTGDGDDRQARRVDVAIAPAR